VEAGAGAVVVDTGGGTGGRAGAPAVAVVVVVVAATTEVPVVEAGPFGVVTIGVKDGAEEVTALPASDDWPGID
jgi:hypothetical protein